MNAWQGLLAILGVALCSGCTVISGVVTDAETEQPMEGVQVGVMVLRPSYFEAGYEERTRTDAEGNYQLVFGPTVSEVSFRQENYLTVTLRDTTDVAALDVALRNIAVLKGTWDVAITVDGAEIPPTTFHFDEAHMVWREGVNSLGAVDYTFDGSAVAIDGALAHGDAISGNFSADLVLSESGEQLSGTVAFDSGLLPGDPCPTGCAGTLVAVPSAVR